MPNTESPVPVQTDTLTNNPVPIRMLTVNAMINGVATAVQMQVISIADEDGRLLGVPYDPRQVLGDISNVLKDIRLAMFKLADLPLVDNIETQFDHPGIVL